MSKRILRLPHSWLEKATRAVLEQLAKTTEQKVTEKIENDEHHEETHIFPWGTDPYSRRPITRGSVSLTIPTRELES